VITLGWLDVYGPDVGVFECTFLDAFNGCL